MSVQAQPLLLFSHGNSFPAGTYQVVLDALRAQGFRVEAVDRFGHDPQYPVTSNWPHLVRQLSEFGHRVAGASTGPVYLVGHSLGGFLSVMCAALHPTLGEQAVAGVVVLDSPLLGGWKARTLQLAKHSRLVGRLSPGRVSRQRRNRWPSAQAALEHFNSKPVFQRWDPRVLQDYITHGTHDHTTEQGIQRVLTFDRDVETQIYNTLPHHLESLLRRHPLPCPMAFVGGTQSQEMRTVGLALTRKLVDPAHPDRMMMIEGSHLFPMERPDETAQAITRALRSFGVG